MVGFATVMRKPRIDDNKINQTRITHYEVNPAQGVPDEHRIGLYDRHFAGGRAMKLQY